MSEFSIDSGSVSYDSFFSNTSPSDIFGLDVNVPEIVQVAQSYNSGPTVTGDYAPRENSIISVKDAVDYGLKATEFGIKTYGQLQDQALNAYVKKENVIIGRTNAQSAADVNKILAQAKLSAAQTIANSARTTSQLANAGQTPQSLMLYLTILGVVFAGIQILKSAR